MQEIQYIQELFQQHNYIMKTIDLYNNQINYENIQYLLKQGYIRKIRHGYYQWINNINVDEISIINNLFPDGILCMDTALKYYGYINITPQYWCLSVNRNFTKSRFCINYPLIKPYYLPNETLHIGETIGYINEKAIKIYTKERTICDCLKRANKMDKEIYSQAIQSYISDNSKDIPHLMEVSKALKVTKKVIDILGIWL